ncbi:GNAT family N-acetyltransferase [Maribacter forsetii]|uniref:GNAT family N-acetyltransferase n=1 Tax=Maribacter forsetii TaxID=444515 RepID=UPI000A05197F|nr:GNAT family N-acetyltransferase [Maribacter forsetii]
MEIVLTNIIVRQMAVNDIPGAMKLVIAENWNQTQIDWQMFLELNSNLCLVATYNNEIVGTVTAINYKNDVAWIGMMLVSKAFRGLGVSKNLLNTIIEKLEGCKSIKLDATAAGIPVYKKIGFQEELEVDRMITTDFDTTINNSSRDTVRAISVNDMEELSALDLNYFGANRLDLINFLKKKNKAWCLIRNECIVAYVFLRPGSNYFQLGPLMAETVDDALNLIEIILEHNIGQSIVIDVLHDQFKFKERLVGLGFSFQRSFVRMYLKDNSFAGLLNKQFLIAGPELG